eukprot:4951872-Amphidinium_carterae.1
MALSLDGDVVRWSTCGSPLEVHENGAAPEWNKVCKAEQRIEEGMQLMALNGTAITEMSVPEVRNKLRMGDTILLTLRPIALSDGQSACQEKAMLALHTQLVLGRCWVHKWTLEHHCPPFRIAITWMRT